MLELRFEMEGEDLLLRRLEGISREMTDWWGVFVKVGGSLKKTFRDNFEVSGALLEKQWAPLKEATRAAKRKKGYPRPDMPLIASGVMMEAFRAKAGKYHVRVYNPIEWFKYHQSRKPRRMIPRRVMISLTKKMRQQIIKMFQKEVEKKLMVRSIR